MRVLATKGSLRASSNTAPREAAPALAPPGMEVAVFRGLGDLPLFTPDLDGEGRAPPSEVAALRAHVASAGGVIISSPEYARPAGAARDRPPARGLGTNGASASSQRGGSGALSTSTALALLGLLDVLAR